MASEHTPRARLVGSRAGSGAPSSLGQGAESSLAPAKRDAGARQGAGVEVGPGALGEEKLGVSALPEQEVAEPLLAARANQEVDVGRGRARLLHEQAREALALALAVLRGRGGEARGRAQDGVARRVIDGEAEMERAALGGGALGVAEQVGEPAGQAVAAAEERELHAALGGRQHLAAQEAAENTKEGGHLGGRAAPVVGGENVQRERADAERGSRLGDLTHALGAPFMTCASPLAAGERPAAVAIEDDGHVRWTGYGQSTLHCKVSSRAEGLSRDACASQRERAARIKASMWSR